MEEVIDMGMTDKQFKSHVRFLLKDLREVQAEKDESKREEKLEQIIETLQATLED